MSDVDFRHLLDSEGEAVRGGADMLDLVERELSAPARFQVLIGHLIAADD